MVSPYGDFRVSVEMSRLFRASDTTLSDWAIWIPLSGFDRRPTTFEDAATKPRNQAVCDEGTLVGVAGDEHTAWPIRIEGDMVLLAVEMPD